LSCKHFERNVICKILGKLTFLINSNFLQTSLAARFQQTSSSYTIKPNCLVKNHPHPITRAEPCDTRYGPAVLLTIGESENSLKKFFLPRRYSDVMTNEDLANINSGKKKLNLVYKNKCSHTNGFLLAITEEEIYATQRFAFFLLLTPD
jgi:hypothetical protein